MRGCNLKQERLIEKKNKTKQDNTANLFSLFIVILGVQLLYVFLICIHNLQYK